MGSSWRRRWSVALLALSAVALLGVTAAALADCGSCCDAMAAEPPAHCATIDAASCCDAPALTAGATAPGAAKAGPAALAALPLLRHRGPARCAEPAESLPPADIALIRSVVLRL